MKRIGRNRRRLIAEIFARIRGVKVYSLDNGFVGKECSVDVVKEAFTKFDFAKLVWVGDKRFQVVVHGNLWYEFESDVEVK